MNKAELILKDLLTVKYLPSKQKFVLFYYNLDQVIEATFLVRSLSHIGLMDWILSLDRDEASIKLRVPGTRHFSSKEWIPVDRDNLKPLQLKNHIGTVTLVMGYLDDDCRPVFLDNQTIGMPEIPIYIFADDVIKLSNTLSGCDFTTN